MNKSLLPHLIKKDFRVVRFWLLALWIFLPLQWIVDLRTSAHPNNNTLTLIMPLATYALIFFAQWRLFKIDPLTGSDHFLQTRPVSRTSLLASKLLLWFFAIILPAALIRSLYLLRFSLGLGVSDYALIFIAWLVFFLAIFSVLLIPIVLTRNLGALLLSVALVVLIPFLFGYFMNQYDRSYPHTSFPVDEHLKTSRIFMVQIFAILFSLIAIFRFYRTPHFSRILLPSGIGIAVVLLAYFAWPVNFVDWLAEKPLIAKKSEWPNMAKFHFHFTDMAGNDYASSGWNNLTFHNILIANTFEGLPKEWVLKQDNYKATAIFANGEKVNGSASQGSPRLSAQIQQSMMQSVKLEPESSSSGKLWIGMKPHSMLQIKYGGGKPDAKNVVAGYLTTALTYCAEWLPANRDLHVRITGRAFFKFWRSKIVGSIPFRNGESLIYRHRRWTIRDIKYSEHDIKYNIVREWPRMELRSMYRNWTQIKPMKEVVFNKQAHVGVGSGFSTGQGSFNTTGGSFLNYTMRVEHDIWHGVRNSETSYNTKMTPEVMKGMKLYIIDYEYGGDFSVPFDVPSVELKR